MDIKERIKRLRREIEASQRTGNKESDSLTIEKLRILLREEEGNRKRIRNIDELANYFEAKVLENDFGRFVVKEGIRNNEFYSDDIESLHILAKEDVFKNFNLYKNVFMDIETSGLSGGVGTFAFLIGIGYLEENTFKIKQFFLPDLPYEKAMLLELASFLKDFESVTTFNGKSFDLPILTSRFRLQMLDEPFFDLHLDLLHIARRVYKRSFEDRSLSSLQQRILGEQRMGDISGNLIPDVYFNFLRKGEISLLGKVIRHNEMDVIAMLRLLSHFVELLKGIENIKSPEVLYSIARLYAELRDYETTITLMKKALIYTEDIPLIFEIKKNLSMIFKKLAMWEEAERLWEELLEETPFEPFPYIELAKFYEHRLKDYKKATDIVNMLKEKLGEGWKYCRTDDLIKRDVRLKKKME